MNRRRSFRHAFILGCAAAATWLLVIGALVAADLTDEQVEVFQKGQDGYHTFRIPSLVVGPKGTLLAICEGRKRGSGDAGDIDLVLKRSVDHGKTWSALEVLYEEGGAEKITIGNPCPVIDGKTGTIWLPFTRNNDRVFITSSSDDGRTWTEPREITDTVKGADWGWYATGPGNGIQLALGKHAGRLVIPCDHRIKGDKSPALMHSHIIYSDDRGRSWHKGELTGGAMNECAVVELSDGTLMLNMRSYRGHAQRAVSKSSDGGQTWSEPLDDPQLIEPICQASLIRYVAPAPDKTQCLLFSNPASPKGRQRLTLRASVDEGRTWPYARLIYEPSSAYSSLAALPDGRIGCLYERDGSSSITFTAVTFDFVKTKAESGN